jgi:hypothetical protein
MLKSSAETCGIPAENLSLYYPNTLENLVKYLLSIGKNWTRRISNKTENLALNVAIGLKMIYDFFRIWITN